eukprot:2579932-Rhodomonas_salina.4
MQVSLFPPCGTVWPQPAAAVPQTVTKTLSLAANARSLSQARSDLKESHPPNSFRALMKLRSDVAWQNTSNLCLWLYSVN